jgi:hypothetical protein
MSSSALMEAQMLLINVVINVELQVVKEQALLFSRICTVSEQQVQFYRWPS